MEKVVKDKTQHVGGDSHILIERREERRERERRERGVE